MLLFLADLWELIRKHPKFFIPVTVLAFLLILFDLFVYYLPSRSLNQFYETLDENPVEAYEMNTRDYREARWPKGAEHYATLYDTFTMPTNLNINIKRPSGLKYFQMAWEKTRSYDVSYDVQERFSKETLLDPKQKRNLQWLQIAHPRDSKALMNGDFDRDTLHMKRHFIKRINLKREEGSWKIQSNHEILVGLKRVANTDEG